MARVLAVALAAFALAGTRPRCRQPAQAARLARAARAAPEGRRGEADLPPERQGRRLAAATTRAAGRSTPTSPRRRTLWTIKVWAGPGRRGRDREGGRHDRRGHRGLDRAAGGLEDGARLPRRLRRARDQQRPGLARLLPALPARARRPAPAASACATSTCSCCSRSPSRSGSSTAATSSRACRWPTRRSSTCSAAWSGARGAGGSAPARCRSGRSGCSRPRPSSRPASGSGSTCAPRT